MPGRPGRLADKGRGGGRYFTPLVVAGSTMFGALVLLPVLALVARALRPEALAQFVSPAGLEALRLSLLTTSLALASTIILGTPTALVLARGRFRGRRLFDAIIDLPIVLPPVVAGVGLLLVFGSSGWLGAPLRQLGVRLPFTTTAVVLAQLFVASPYYVRTLKAGFRAVPERLEGVSLTLGKGRAETFWRVTLPLAFPHLIEGAVMAWARALGEFGATIVFAGSFAGRTRTLPLAIYAALERDLDSAIALAALLAGAAFLLLLVFRTALRRPAEVGRVP